jgi:hypothetical protein
MALDDAAIAASERAIAEGAVSDKAIIKAAPTPTTTPTTPTPPPRISIVSWYANKDSQALATNLYGSSLGQHATPDEVAITQHIAPLAFEGKNAGRLHNCVPTSDCTYCTYCTYNTFLVMVDGKELS